MNSSRHLTRSEYLSRAREFAKRGESLPQSRLNQDAVKAIRANVRGKSAKALAADYGVHYRTIEKVQYFETWVHV